MNLFPLKLVQDEFIVLVVVRITGIVFTSYSFNNTSVLKTNT